MVHDINAVHGLLEPLGEPVPATVVDASCWAGGSAALLGFRLSSGGRWSNALLELPRLHEFRETITFYFPDSVRSLTFPVPYLRHAPTIYRTSGYHDEAGLERVWRSYREAFLEELRHFHACIVDGQICRTPPAQAVLDVDALAAAVRMALGQAAIAGWV
jgi:hypothetical protein